MYVAQITFYASRVVTFETEITIDDASELDTQVENEKRELKFARTYDEVCVSCADLDYAVTLTK